ncbi:MAG: DUF308 domain-containing protein [Bacilli bacterium]|nr:DUF308 domain-containing protein [Bacilli bacterium]
MEFLKEIKSTLFIITGLYIVIGLIMLIAPVMVTNMICYLVGTLCLILGGIGIYTYVSSEVYGPLSYAILVISIAMIVLGIFVIVDPKSFISVIPFIAGIILVIDAFTKLQSSSSLKRYNYDRWWVVLVASLVIFAFGILLIVFSFESIILFIRILGFFLILTSVSSFFTAMGYQEIEKRIK